LWHFLTQLVTPDPESVLRLHKLIMRDQHAAITYLRTMSVPEQQMLVSNELNGETALSLAGGPNCRDLLSYIMGRVWRWQARTRQNARET
jgi:hypothetical protein